MKILSRAVVAPVALACAALTAAFGAAGCAEKKVQTPPPPPAVSLGASPGPASAPPGASPAPAMRMETEQGVPMPKGADGQPL